VSESSSTSPILGIIVVLLVAILLAVTNPPAEAHRRAIAEGIGRSHPVAGAVGLAAMSAAMPTYHSFVIGSYTTADGAVTSIGLLGMIRVPEPEAR